MLVKAQRGIMVVMIAKMLKDMLDQAETWPQQDQEELAEYAREIQARRTGVYVMSDEERAAVRRGLAQADRGEFVADEVVAEADKRHDL
jgi:predicted transcriptional regulator